MGQIARVLALIWRSLSLLVVLTGVKKFSGEQVPLAYMEFSILFMEDC